MSKVYFIGAGPGDPELITLKAVNILKKCRCVIWAGSLVSEEVLTHCAGDAEIFDSASMNLEEIIAKMREAVDKGLNVARLHTGDPSVYGAIFEQMAELDKLGIEHEIIPGVSSVFAAAASLGCELTKPEVSQSVVITRTPGRTPMPEAESVYNFAKTGATLCFYLSALKAEHIVSECIRAGLSGQTPAACVYRASWPDEVKIISTLQNIQKDINSAGITKHALIIVGDALSTEIDKYSRLYDGGFSHGCR